MAWSTNCPLVYLIILALQVSAAYVKKYGLVYKLCIGPSALLVVADPEEVAKLTSNSNRLDNLPKLTEAYQVLEAVGVPY